MLYRIKIHRIGLKRGMLFTTLVFGLAQVALAATPTTTSSTNSGPSVAPLILSGRQSTRPAGTYSAAVTEIIKMLDAKVDESVIVAYVQNPTILYYPEASELIALKEHGASTDLLRAVLHHGDELRQQLGQAQSAVNPPSEAPAYDYVPQAASAANPYGYPDSTGAPTPTPDYSEASGEPLTYWPSVGVSGYGPYGYPHGRYYPPRGNGGPVGGGGHPNRIGPALPTPHAPPSVSAPGGGATSSPILHPGGPQSSGRSGGRSGGRSR